MSIQKQLLSAGFSAGQCNAICSLQVSAAAGTTISDATKITSAIAVFTSGDGDSVLPTPDAGDSIVVVNVSGNNLDIWPASGGGINALGADTKLTIATAKSCLLVAQTSTQWRTIPLVPS